MYGILLSVAILFACVVGVGFLSGDLTSPTGEPTVETQLQSRGFRVIAAPSLANDSLGVISVVGTLHRSSQTPTLEEAVSTVIEVKQLRVVERRGVYDSGHLIGVEIVHRMYAEAPPQPSDLVEGPDAGESVGPDGVQP